MKKTFRSLLIMTLALSLIVTLFTGCFWKVEKIELEEDEITLTVGEKYEVEYEVLPEKAAEKAELTWESDDEDVAKVNSNGRINAKGPGECTVTVTAENGVSAEIEVTVLTAIENINLETYSVNMRPGDVYYVGYSVYPEDATGELTWESDDESVATVDDGEIYAVDVGYCTITVSASEDVTATIEVEVSDSSDEESLLVGTYALDFTYVGEYTSDPDAATLYIYSDGSGELYYYGELYSSFSWWYEEGNSYDGYYYTVYTSAGVYESIYIYGTDSDYTGDVNYYTADGETFYFNG